MDYHFRTIEKKWQKYWSDTKTFRAEIDSRPKYYVLDMFPYPSGAGLHVGHPLGYIASDIFSRYKRIKGFNVLHPMGYDAFGLPAEQYAIQTGQHPAITTGNNIKRYREQLDNIGFSFDWDKEVRTSEPSYYKWTQWIFIRLFDSWYNKKTNTAEPVSSLVEEFGKNGNAGVEAVCEATAVFSAVDWQHMTEKQQQELLLNYRLAYLSDTMVNWCPGLGTVLANEEVKDGLSERGGFPVVRKLMKQWSLRITAYAERLINDLDTIDWPDSIREAQRNWIGRSEGTTLSFELEGHNGQRIEVFTTRPDTIFGVTFLTLAPENELVQKITTEDRKKAVQDYITFAKNRSERDRMADVKKISGEFTGAYVLHPFTGKQMPVWIGDYVLAGYGTGAVMAVPGHDTRDYAFARYFSLPVVEVVAGGDLSKEAYDAKEGRIINSGFLDGLEVKEAVKAAIKKIEEKGIGKGRINYRLRDAIFSRQRYWGEPFPVYYKDGMPYMVEESELPVKLPEVDAYLPTETGEPPLARAKNWTTKEGYPLETNTMPGWAGSSWYFLRYMDPLNDKEFASKDAINYWENVDLYMGGAEHATGHLLYVRFWTKFLYDLGYIPMNEPAKKLINQGMIQGRSNFVYRYKVTNIYVSKGIADGLLSGAISSSDVPELTAGDFTGGEWNPGMSLVTALHVDVNIVENDILDTEAFKKWRPGYENARFILENGKYICGVEVEKMSKSKWNVINPDDLIEYYGADTLRLYEMFLGPLELSKPWNTNGITGVYGFLRKFWKLFHDADHNFSVADEPASRDELKVLHKTMKKVEEDIERFSFNTSVSTFMICTNELTDLKCSKREILEPLVIVLSPYAPHIAEELWSLLGHSESISKTVFPQWKEEFLTEDSFEYPVSINGKTRTKMNISLKLSKEDVEKEVLSSEEVKKWLQDSPPKKVIVVPGRIVNIVV